jgi:hypothetical protein
MIRDRSPIRRARFGTVCALVLGGALLSAAVAQDDSTKKSTAPDSGTHKNTSAAAKTSNKGSSSKRRRKKSARLRGQQKIDSERAQAIQEALIREHYLTGTATGKWNQASEEAMRRYQADNGWQSKTVPDSRALIKLGLGPSKDQLLNPESAMTTVPDAPKAEPMRPVSHSATPAADPLPPGATPSTPTTSNPAAASSTPSGPQRRFSN